MEKYLITIGITSFNSCKTIKKAIDSAIDQSWINKEILIVDDINDTGATFNWIKNDWESRHNDPDKWARIWGGNVKFATLTENLASKFGSVSYSCDEVNKAEEDVWLVYPWENVGKYD